MRKRGGLLKEPPVVFQRTPGGIALGDHVSIDRPGWYGHGEVGAVAEIHHGVYVRIADGQCFRMLEEFLTKVDRPDCHELCCTRWRAGRDPDADREILQEKIQDL